MMAELSKIDVAAFRKADRVTIGYDCGTTIVHCVKTQVISEANPFASECYHAIAAEVRVLKSDQRDDISAAYCRATFGLYENTITTQSSILANLRAGDVPVFTFYPDYHSTLDMMEAGFHGDALILEIRRGGKTVAHFELQAIVTRGRSRMCKGIVRKEAETAAA
jgi:hypothetical protein